MSEPIPGSARTTEIDMTPTTLLEHVAASFCDDVNATDTEREAFMLAIARVAEMNTTGFDTTAWFNHDYLAPRVNTPEGVFTVASLGKTGTTYLVAITKRVDDAYRAAVQIYTPGVISDKFYRMTMTCADNGTVRMNAGW
ncbi:MAG TPA: hypothetical protein VLG09_04160 [Candidatus Saccharimonadales bacterium]|nr:hypothetical protein [Candidatus Saccharimonadales bacterium]